MINILNFSSQRYKNHAMHHRTKYENQLTSTNAFMLCLKDLPFEDLDNLCNLLQNYYNSKNIPISLEACYQITQSYNSKETEKTILSLAYELVHSGKTLGTKERENGEGPSSLWLNHILIEAEVAENLAKKQGLDTDTAKKLAILHDIGRKFTHTPLHTIAGFEYLVDEGYYDEAFICLTHSFLCNKNKKGEKCATCEPVVNGFFIDENGNPQLLLNAQKDDILTFLEKYRYSAYDSIINLADLMSSSKNVLSPYDRVKEIEERKPLDDINKNFFKLTLCNNMLAYLKNSQESNEETPTEIKYSSQYSDKDIDKIFYDISLLFTDFYERISNSSINTNSKQNTKKQN